MTKEYDDDFVAWVTARQPSLLRFGYLLTGDPHAAEDLVQTALAKAYLKWDLVSGASSREAYVRRIIVNTYTSIWRRPFARHEVVSQPAIDYLTEVSGTQDTALFDSDLWELVRGLPTKQRAALVLRYYEQLTEAEAAEVLGCSVGNIKSQTHRALATLRARLQEVPL